MFLVFMVGPSLQLIETTILLSDSLLSFLRFKTTFPKPPYTVPIQERQTRGLKGPFVFVYVQTGIPCIFKATQLHKSQGY